VVMFPKGRGVCQTITVIRDGGKGFVSRGV